MTPEQINVAIAQWCGWSHIDRQFMDGFSPTHEYNKIPESEIVDGPRDRIPDYFRDLNAISEAEKLIKDTRRGQYNAELSKLSAQRNLSSAIKEPEFIFQLLTATAPQRAEALLRTLNLWKDTP